MALTMEQMSKEKIINDYFSLLDLNENNIDYKKIEHELSLALGEKPAVQLIYEDDVVMNEDGTKEEKRISNITSINVYYTYNVNGNIQFGKKTYIIA
jgi:hypothetical protein